MISTTNGHIGFLLGGYGGDKEDFLSMIADSWAVRDGRVDIVQYVERMEDVWDATKLFVFPSRFEGYGMAAVEPMMHGVPRYGSRLPLH